MKLRLVRIALPALMGTLVVVPAGLDWPALSGGRFWSDGATYTMMAESLARDLDLRYERQDLRRILPEFPEGPEGVFLKRSHGGLAWAAAAGPPWLRSVPKQAPEIYYAKSFAYAVVAAPLVRLLGVRGLPVVNGALLAMALGLGEAGLRRRGFAPARALLLTLALVFGTVAPLYLVWPQPELFGFFLVTAALSAWSFDRPAASAALFGIASYAKPPNLLLALPLCAAPMLDGGRPWIARLRTSLGRGARVALVAGGCFAATALVTGEANYQGGERKTFYGVYPFSAAGATFGNSGFWMTTDHVGPRIEGLDSPGRRGAVAVAAAEVRQDLLRNLAYFWIGRYAGVLPYFLPVAAALLLFLVRGPRETAGWMAATSLVLSSVTYVWLIPDNWYGGGGTLGNRYFLALLPLAFLFVPRRGGGLVIGCAVVSGTLLIAPMALSPVESALSPGRHAALAPFRWLPLELTMLNDLGFNHEPWRKKQPFGDPEGDPGRGRAADPRAYWLYFPDDGSYGRERAGGVEGFWVRGGATAEVVVRALEPVTRLRAHVVAGPGGDRVRLETGAGSAAVMLPADAAGDLALDPGPAVLYYDSLLYVVRLKSGAGLAPARLAGHDARVLGSFVHIELDVRARPHAAPSRRAG